MFTAFLHGILLAFGLILPLGVQNVFVFNQGIMHQKWRQGLPVVITAALCDTVLISAAVLGVSVVVLRVGWLQTGIKIVGLLFLLYMGWMTWRSKPEEADDGEEARSWSPERQVLFAMSVSLLNPHAILDTIGVIGTSSLEYPMGSAKLAFTLACIGVSWLWFLGLMTAGHLLGSLEGTARYRVWLNRVSAVIMWGSGLFLAFK
ncbi:MAG: LysE/ArgO family amino acid transporter [Tumebacillaceae bacterium]